MSDQKFWKIIELIDVNNIEVGIKQAIELLSSYMVDEIKGFEETLAKKLHKLDLKILTKEIGENAYKNEDT